MSDTIERLLLDAKKLQVMDAETCAQAIDLIRALQEAVEIIEASFAADKKPLRDQLNSLLADEKKAVGPLVDASENLRLQVSALHEERLLPIDIGHQKGFHFTPKYTILVEDEDAVPSDFKSADIKKIRKFVQKTTGAVQVPGVSIIKGFTLNIRKLEDA